MNRQRRTFLSRIVAFGTVAWAMPASLFANWPKSAFNKTKLEESLTEITGGAKLIEDKVRVTAPKIAENGAQVRVEVAVDAENVEWIGILVEKNPIPFVSKFIITKHSTPHVSTNVKVRETSDVIAIAKADGALYRGQQTVRVTAGGCA